MNRSTLFTIAVALSLAAPAMAKGDSPMSTDQKQVLAAVEAMTAAFHDGNIEEVMAAYEGKATIVFEPDAPVSDPALIRQAFETSFAIKPRFTYSGHEVFMAGDIAVHFAPWRMTGTTPDGQAIEQSGLSVAVLRRQPDGRWLMVIDNPHGQNLMQQ